MDEKEGSQHGGGSCRRVPGSLLDPPSPIMGGGAFDRSCDKHSGKHERGRFFGGVRVMEKAQDRMKGRSSTSSMFFRIARIPKSWMMVWAFPKCEDSEYAGEFSQSLTQPFKIVEGRVWR